ncbi:MAG: hypothetical protein IJQ04_01960 [Prevotella sp.]|nr:hypothetical protein [Prevotella sp.]
MEQAMEAWGRATAAGYNILFSPVVKVVTGKAAWVMDEGIPFYYDVRALSALDSKQELERHRAYRGGQPARSRGAAKADANLTAFVKGLGLGVSADELIWEKDATNTFEETAKSFATVVRCLRHQERHTLSGTRQAHSNLVNKNDNMRQKTLFIVSLLCGFSQTVLSQTRFCKSLPNTRPASGNPTKS